MNPEITFVLFILVALVILVSFVYSSVTVPTHVVIIYGAK